MFALALGWLYRKLGSFYPATFLTLQFQTAIPIVVATVFLLSFYFKGSKSDYFLIGAIALSLTVIATTLTLLRLYPRMRPVIRWIDGDRGPEASTAAWEAAVSLPIEMIRRSGWLPIVVVVIPASVAAMIILDFSWLAFFPFFAFAMIALGYSWILHYLMFEAGLRPVLMDINRNVSPRMRTDCPTFSLRFRLLAALPLINLITGITVAALTSEGGGAADLGFDVLIALLVATTIALELTVLLSKSILRPIADLRRATEAVREGRYDVAVPVTTGDELGELAASFNQMVSGLAERERIREAFGTYLDRSVAEIVLSGQFPEEGIEVDVSILFADVRDFTSFAHHADAREVVARLNELFGVMVPIVARHGGHIDKFEGDGVLAVFGAPEGYRDHADRAVRAAVEMARRVNDGVAGDLRIGVGVNSGEVVAGSIGAAGRLNFSVIGDAVNIASRVEAVTRGPATRS